MKGRRAWLWYGLTAVALLLGIIGGAGTFLRQRRRQRTQARIRQRLLEWHEHVAGSLRVDQQTDWEAAAAAAPEGLLRSYLTERPVMEGDGQ